MSILAARSAKHSLIRMDRPLTDDEIRAVAPSIYAEAPHSSRSDRYQYIATSEVLDSLRKEGFMPFSAAQARVGKKGMAAGKQDYTRHMLRFRHADAIKDNDGAHEIILLNSHDGTSSYQMLSGMFRFVCMNGLVLGEVEKNVRIHHKGDALTNVIEGAFTVLSETKGNQSMIENMMNSRMSAIDQANFADRAIALRFGEDNKVLTSAQVLEARRSEDTGNDRWSVFNRVQENLIRGGMDGRSTKNRVRKVREIVGMDKDIKFNRGLWQIMAEA